MMQIQSPFLQEIPQRKVTMRKLRKKIYKYTSTHRPSKKPKDSISDILTLLKPRNLPSFLLDPIKKRRSFDITNIKNILIPPVSSLPEIQDLTSHQESQIQTIFQEHRIRMQQDKKHLKLDKKSTNFSSTEENSSHYSSQDDIFQQVEQIPIQPKESNDIPSITHDSDGLFKNHGFLALQKDLYSQEQWLRF